MSNSIVALGGLAVAFGLPAYYVVIKWRAAASLNTLIAERFAERPCPVGEVHTKIGRINFYGAYRDTRGSGLVLVLGNLRRSRTAYNRVAGLFKPGGNLHSKSAAQGKDVLLTTNVAGGDLIVWKGLPSRDSVLAHLKSVGDGPSNMKEQREFRPINDAWEPPPEFRISTPRPIKWSKAGVANLVFASLIGFFGFFVVGGVYDDINRDHRLVAEGNEIDGAVTRTWTEVLKSTHYHVAYEFPAAGKTVKGEGELAKKKWQQLSPGSRVSVRYVPSQPEINRPALAYQRLLPYWIPLLVFLGWIGILVLAVFPIRKEKRLLKYGQPAAGVITYATQGRRAKYGWISKFEFQLADGTTVKGSTQRDRTYFSGQKVCIVYDPKHPKRNEIYPTRLARIVQ